MKRYEVTFTASLSGTICHFVRAGSMDQAKDRIHSAYPVQQIEFVKVARR